MTQNHVDYLIIGQGIAGTLFSDLLSQAGKRFIIIDDNCTANASQTAAGMYNPVVLKRFSPVWQGAAQIQTAKQQIAQLEKRLNHTLDYPLPIYRVFHDDNEQTTWLKKAQQAPLAGLLSSTIIKNDNSHIMAPHGLGEVHLGGRVNLSLLLSSYQQYLLSKQQLRQQVFDYHALEIHDNNVVYDDIVATNVVFCEGYGLTQNPYFNYLPMPGNKGEVLIVRVPDLQLTNAIKSGVFIMPLPEMGDDVYFVGATYHWHDKDSTPTEAGKQQLLDKLSTLIDATVEIIEHRAGMRPTVSDRRPLLGQHETYTPLYLLNGLGTRGVMLGATMAQYLYDFIEHDQELPAEVNIKRFHQCIVL